MSAIDSRLLSFIERIERLEEEKRSIADDIKDVKTEAKSAGFDVKTITKIIAERRLSPAERRRERALLDLYRAGAGLLDGTPLGDAARERMMAEEPNAEAPPPAPRPEDTRTAEEARAEGAAAFKAGARIVDNPYVAGDPRRAAWDEGFCAASGSDGMDIPEAWRRKPKKAKPPADAEPAGDEVDPDQQDLPMGEPPAPPKSEDGNTEEAPPADPPPQAAPAEDPARRLDDHVKRRQAKQAEDASRKAAAKRSPKGPAKGSRPVDKHVKDAADRAEEAAQRRRRKDDAGKEGGR